VGGAGDGSGDAFDVGRKATACSLRVTSRGHTIVHEFQEANTLLDATKYDHPVTMLYVNGEELNLVHYCDAGNRPHMVGDVCGRQDGGVHVGRVSGSTKNGHMQSAVFTYIDANHHTRGLDVSDAGRQGDARAHRRAPVELKE